MADRIIDVLCDPKRAYAMGERGRQIAAEKFSCVAQLERTLALYDSLLTESAISFAHAPGEMRQKRA